MFSFSLGGVGLNGEVTTWNMIVASFLHESVAVGFLLSHVAEADDASCQSNPH